MASESIELIGHVILTCKCFETICRIIVATCCVVVKLQNFVMMVAPINMHCNIAEH